MSEVTVDGQVPIPTHRWYQIEDIFTRIDEQLEVLIKLVDRTNRLLEQISLRVGAPAGPPTVVVEEAQTNRYKVYKLDLSKARDNEPLGISDLDVVAKSATVTRLDSPAYWRRNDPNTGDMEELSAGYHISNFEIRELFITNSAGSGYLTIVIEWRE